MLSICTAPRDELGFPGYLTGLLTIRPHTESLAKKGRRIVHPLGSLRPGLSAEGINTLEVPMSGLERVGRGRGMAGAREQARVGKRQPRGRRV